MRRRRQGFQDLAHGAGQAAQRLQLRLARLFRMAQPFGRGGEEVQDPYYGGTNGFEEVYQQVVRFSRLFLEHVEKRE